MGGNVREIIMMSAFISSSRTISLFSTSIIYCSYLDLYWKKMALWFSRIVCCQKYFRNIFLWSGGVIQHKNSFASYNCLSFQQTFFLLKLFLSLDLSIIAFLRAFVIKALLLKRRTFTLTGPILFKISRNTASKVV